MVGQTAAVHAKVVGKSSSTDECKEELKKLLSLRFDEGFCPWLPPSAFQPTKDGMQNTEMASDSATGANFTFKLRKEVKVYKFKSCAEPSEYVRKYREENGIRLDKMHRRDQEIYQLLATDVGAFYDRLRRGKNSGATVINGQICFRQEEHAPPGTQQAQYAGDVQTFTSSQLNTLAGNSQNSFVISQLAEPTAGALNGSCEYSGGILLEGSREDGIRMVESTSETPTVDGKSSSATFSSYCGPHSAPCVGSASLSYAASNSRSTFAHHQLHPHHATVTNLHGNNSNFHLTAALGSFPNHHRNSFVHSSSKSRALAHCKSRGYYQMPFFNITGKVLKMMPREDADE